MFREVNSTSKEEMWRSRLRRFRSSGMAVTRFCHREQVSVPSFYHWRKRLALEPEKKDLPLFVPVHVTHTLQSRSTYPTERECTCRQGMRNPCGWPWKRQDEWPSLRVRRRTHAELEPERTDLSVHRPYRHATASTG